MQKIGIAIIGGGVVGTSIAYHLGALGVPKVVLFERGTIGCGTTGKATGGLRSLFPHRLESELSIYGKDGYLRLEELSGRSLGFRSCGYLLLAFAPSRERALEQSAANATALGTVVEELSASEVMRIAPGLDVAGVRKAVLSPRDGYILRPVAAACAYGELAARSGALVMEHTAITAIRAAGSGFALKHGDDTSYAEQVVFATNAYAGHLLHDLGVCLPSYPYPRHVFTLAPAPPLMDPAMPIVVFQDRDVMLRHEGQLVLLVCGTTEQSTYDPYFDPERLPVVRERVEQLVSKGDAEISHIWSGLRAMTPDRRALVGTLPGVSGAWCAIGFSGHGIMHAPAIGRSLAEWILLGRPQRFDLAPLAPSRFGCTPTAAPPILEPGHQ